MTRVALGLAGTQSSNPLTLGALGRLPVGRFSRRPLRAHGFIMGLLFMSAIVVAYILLPGESERIAMLERDGKTREARAILEAAFAKGDRRQRTLFQLQGLYEQSGNLPKAREMLVLLTDQRPRDVALQKQYGLFLKQTNDEPGYIRSLSQQITLRYSESACREFIGLLRRSGQYDEERAALQACRQKGYRRPDDMVRLASLLEVDGDKKEASVLLRAVDDLRRLKVERERLQLFDLLIELKQPYEAERRGARWLKGAKEKGAKEDGLALTLISLLVGAELPDLAIELARDTSVPGDSVFLTIPEIMVDRLEVKAAEGLLRGWLDQATTLEVPVAQRFIRASLSAGAPDLALACAQRVGLAAVGVDLVHEMARGFDAIGRKVDGDTLRATIGSESSEFSPPQHGKVSMRDKARGALGFSIASLDQWRADLWTRVSEANKPSAVAVGTTPPNSAGVAGRSPRGWRGLRALRQAKRFNTYRRHQTLNAGPTKKPGSDPLGFFGLKTGE